MAKAKTSAKTSAATAATTAAAEPEKTRNSELYFGQTTTVFVDLAKFEYTTDGIKFTFDGFASRADFEDGKPPLGFLRRVFELENEAFAEFKTANEAVLSQLIQTALSILDMNVSEWNLKHLTIKINDRVTVLIANKNAFETRERVETLSGAEHDKAMAAHHELVQAALGLAWSFGKEKDSFLAFLS